MDEEVQEQFQDQHDWDRHRLNPSFQGSDSYADDFCISHVLFGIRVIRFDSIMTCGIIGTNESNKIPIIY